MSDNDLIRRGDALAAVKTGGLISLTIASLPAVTVGVPEATVYRAVLDWIRDDAGAAVKMSMTPDRANALTARILAALDLTPATDAQAVRDAALREAAEVVTSALDGAGNHPTAIGLRAVYADLAKRILALIGKEGA